MQDGSTASPFLDEIFIQTISMITQNEEFDEDVLGRVTKLMETNELADAEAVIKALSIHEED